MTNETRTQTRTVYSRAWNKARAAGERLKSLRSQYQEQKAGFLEKKQKLQAGAVAYEKRFKGYIQSADRRGEKIFKPKRPLPERTVKKRYQQYTTKGEQLQTELKAVKAQHQQLKQKETEHNKLVADYNKWANRAKTTTYTTTYTTTPGTERKTGVTQLTPNELINLSKYGRTTAPLDLKTSKFTSKTDLPTIPITAIPKHQETVTPTFEKISLKQQKVKALFYKKPLKQKGTYLEAAPPTTTQKKEYEYTKAKGVFEKGKIAAPLMASRFITTSAELLIAPFKPSTYKAGYQMVKDPKLIKKAAVDYGVTLKKYPFYLPADIAAYKGTGELFSFKKPTRATQKIRQAYEFKKTGRATEKVIVPRTKKVFVSEIAITKDLKARAARKTILGTKETKRVFKTKIPGHLKKRKDTTFYVKPHTRRYDIKPSIFEITKKTTGKFRLQPTTPSKPITTKTGKKGLIYTQLAEKKLEVPTKTKYLVMETGEITKIFKTKKTNRASIFRSKKAIAPLKPQIIINKPIITAIPTRRTRPIISIKQPKPLKTRPKSLISPGYELKLATKLTARSKHKRKPAIHQPTTPTTFTFSTPGATTTTKNKMTTRQIPKATTISRQKYKPKEIKVLVRLQRKPLKTLPLLKPRKKPYKRKKKKPLKTLLKPTKKAYKPSIVALSKPIIKGKPKKKKFTGIEIRRVYKWK